VSGVGLSALTQRQSLLEISVGKRFLGESFGLALIARHVRIYGRALAGGYNQTDRVLEQRQQVLDAVYQLHPERFVRSAPRPPAVPTEAWINKPVQLT
jgi:hypothetical protein